MTFKEMMQHIDSALIDYIFQPVTDRLPESLSAWALAMSCQLGSVLLQVVSIAAPILLYGASLGQSVEASLVLVSSIIFFMGIQRFQVLVRPGIMNPLRVMFWGLRMLALTFLLYQAWTLLSVEQALLLWAELGELSQVVFVTGLYFMACQPRPPMVCRKEKRVGQGRVALHDI